MKNIIVSDIGGKANSIIPHGLQITRQLEYEAEVLHIIDSRMLRSAAGPVADSQHISPSPMSHEDILEHDKGMAREILDRIIGAEGSRLNFPLKIHSSILEGSAREIIGEYVEKEDSGLLTINAADDQVVFDSTSDILETVRNVKIPVYLVPPDTTFEIPDEVLLVVEHHLEELRIPEHIRALLKPLDAEVHILHMGEMHGVPDITTEGIPHEVSKKVKENFAPFPVKAIQVEGKDYADAVVKHLIQDPPSMVMVCCERKSALQRTFQKNITREILKSVEAPVLLFPQAAS